MTAWRVARSGSLRRWLSRRVGATAEASAVPVSDPALVPRRRWTADGATWGARLGFVLPRACIGLLLLYGAWRALLWASDWPSLVALITQCDHGIYMAQAHRVLGGGPLYPSWELAGPFGREQNPEVYPPLTVYGLLVPMSLLPDPLWWLIPIATIAAVVAHYRPSAWTWALILALFIAVPSTWGQVAAGNPALWVAAGVGLATIRPSFALAALLKPPLVLFVLIGARSRVLWIGVAIYVALMLLLLPAWVDYTRVLLNYRSSPTFFDVPLVLIPLAAWLGALTRRSPGRVALADAGSLPVGSTGALSPVTVTVRA